MAFLSKFISEWRYSLLSPYINGDIIDIGCGRAQILTKYQSKIKTYCGVDSKINSIRLISQQFPNAVFMEKDLDHELLDIDSYFDVVLMLAVIEHLWNQEFLFYQIVKLLKPGGKIIITTPSPFGNDFIYPLGVKIGVFSKNAMNNHIVIYNRRRFQTLSKKYDMKMKVYKRFQLFCNQFVVLTRNEY